MSDWASSGRGAAQSEECDGCSHDGRRGCHPGGDAETCAGAHLMLIPESWLTRMRSSGGELESGPRNRINSKL